MTRGAGPSVSDSHHATYAFEYDDRRRARLVADSVRREVGEIDDDRSRATLQRDGTTVTVQVDARDLVALRAATNTWTGLVDVAERTLDGLDRTTAGHRDGGNGP